MKTFFIPPDFNLAIAWFSDSVLPITLKHTQNIKEVLISQEDKEKMIALHKERYLFFTNHPSQAEPMIAYYIANAIGTRFHYLATRRAFDFALGLVGKWFQGTKTFSVMPGVADKESMRMTRLILSDKAGKLVIFPEGEPMCSENDSLMPFQPGIIKMGFSSLSDAKEKDPKAEIHIIPGFIKYVINTPKDKVIKNLENHISIIERKLNAKAGGRNLLRRFLMVGRILLEKAEKDYGINVDNPDFNYRIGHVRHAILDNLAKLMNLKHYDHKADAIQKLRTITATLELVEVGYPSPELPKLNSSQLDFINKECIKAYDFIVIKNDYLISYPSPERFYEWLQRFESLVLGKNPRMLGGEIHPEPRTAHVFLGNIIKFGTYYDSYKKNKNKVVDEMLLVLRTDMQSMLDKAQKLTEPIVQPGDIGGL
jgi:1-acyl-sn-glycerol-3-phosphate acyltransferase